MGRESLILADIHANLAALEAVLQKEKTWDEVLFLGDAVQYGPHPQRVLSLLSELNGIYVAGNTDAEVLEVDLDTSSTDPDAIWLQWSRRQLSTKDLRFLETFQPTAIVSRHGLTIRLIHGILPPEQGERLWPDSDISTFAYLENRYPEEIILLGHSHVQFQHRGFRASFVNPGAVGQQRLGQPLACYAVLRDGHIDLRAVEYDSGKTAADMERIDFEDREFVGEWKRGYLDGVLPSRYNMRDLSPLRQRGYR